jgi:hypothetical protein
MSKYKQWRMKMNIVKTGNKKKAFKSIRLAAEAAGVPYMTFYMRLRMGKPVKQAMKQPIRKYQKCGG